mgnify:CR=1 FL=1
MSTPSSPSTPLPRATPWPERCGQLDRVCRVGIANVINIFEPEIICIGGGVSNQGETLLAPVRAYAENETKNITTGRFPKIVACTLHNDAASSVPRPLKTLSDF